MHHSLGRILFPAFRDDTLTGQLVAVAVEDVQMIIDQKPNRYRQKKR